MSKGRFETIAVAMGVLLGFGWMAGCATSSPMVNAVEGAPPVAAGQSIIDFQYSGTQPPTGAEGCEFDGTDPMSWALLCPGIDAVVGRVGLGNHQDVTEQMVLEGFTRSMSDIGWTLALAGSQRVAYGEEAVTLHHYAAVFDEQRYDVYAGLLATPGAKSLRMANCVVQEGTDPSELGCGAHLLALMQFAEANRITGISIKGKPIAIPERCEVSDHSIRCGQDVITWMEFGPQTPREELTSIERHVFNMLDERGARVERLDAVCRFGGDPMSCTFAVFQLPGYREQGIVFGYADAGERSVRLLCDVVALPSPFVLPEPCSLFFDVSVGKRR
jgi:hypothetical protein